MLLYNQLRQLQPPIQYSIESYEPFEPPEEKTQNHRYIKTAIKDRSPLLNRVNLNLLNLQNNSNNNTQVPIIKKLNFDLCLANNNNVLKENNNGNLYTYSNLMSNNTNNLVSPAKIKIKNNGNISNNNCIQPIINKNSFNYGNNAKIPLYNYIQPQTNLNRSKSSKYLSPFKHLQILNQKTMNNNKIILTNKINQLSPPRFVQNHNINSNKKIVPIYRKIVYRRRHLFEN